MFKTLFSFDAKNLFAIINLMSKPAKVKLVIWLVLCSLCADAQVPAGEKSEAEKFSVKYGKVRLLAGQLDDSVSGVSKVPDTFHFNPYYQKYLNAAGLPIIGSANVSDRAFYKTREIVLMMLRKSPGIKAKMIGNNARIAIIGKDEELTDLPEYNSMDKSMNQRARGLGGWIDAPLTSCAEENVLGLNTDRYKGEDILIHEFAHAIHMLGISFADKDFNDQLKTCYKNALDQGLWKNTYAISNEGEYFAEGVQSWFNVNAYLKAADGIHNEIDTHEELKLYDPGLYKLISKYFNNDQQNRSIHFEKKVTRKWMSWDARQ